MLEHCHSRIEAVFLRRSNHVTYDQEYADWTALRLSIQGFTRREGSCIYTRFQFTRC